MVVIGVLALQGDFERHLQTLRRTPAHTLEVRTTKDLDQTGALILPGGESTTLRKMMKAGGLWSALMDRRMDDFPVFGTCAGLILMGEQIADARPDEDSLGYLNLTTRRNAYGRQRESFIAPLEARLNGRVERADALFIRAPRIGGVGRQVRVLAEYEGAPVLVQQGSSLGAAFHPELTENTAIHAYFAHLVKERWS